MSTVLRPAFSVRVQTRVGLARSYVALTKPRIIELLLVTTVPAMIVARQGMPSFWLMVATVTGGTFAAGGANAINMYIDRDIDRLMRRTKNRPLVTGVIEPAAAIRFAVGLELVAFVELWTLVNLYAACLAVAATLFYVFVYTLWLKRTSANNIVIGGAAGAVPVLVGWAAVSDRLTLAPWLMFAVIFFWTPPHFWSLAIRYRDDYAAADVPMMPVVRTMEETANHIVVYTLVTWAFSVAFGLAARMGIFYLVSALVLGGVFAAKSEQLRRDPVPGRAIRLFTYSITYLTLLFAAMALDVFVR